MKLIINTDGGARGNPGPAGIGVVIRNEKNIIIAEHREYIGEATNNVAEYKALIRALKEAQEISNSHPPAGGPITNLEIRMDSELIVRQMQGRYKIKEPNLQVLAAEVLRCKNGFKEITFKHVPREQNKEADKLVNAAIDEATQ